MRVCVDNSVIGRLLDIERGLRRGSQMLEEDMAILPRLLQLCAERGILLCVSDEARAEIEKVRATMPHLAEALLFKLQSFTLLAGRDAIKNKEGQRGDTGATYAEGSPTQVDWLTQELETFLLSKTRVTKDIKKEAVRRDAYYLAVCLDSGGDVFLTCDYASIWAYRRALKRLFGLEVRRPVELLEQVRRAIN